MGSGLSTSESAPVVSAFWLSPSNHCGLLANLRHLDHASCCGSLAGNTDSHKYPTLHLAEDPALDWHISSLRGK